MPHTILLADDSVTIQRVVDIVFEKEADFTIVKVGNGDDAVARARELRPALVLADHGMPGLSGYEVAEALKGDGIPVLLLSGSSAPFDEARAQAAGCVGHLAKPFDCQSLLDRVLATVGGSTSSDPMANKGYTLTPAGSAPAAATPAAATPAAAAPQPVATPAPAATLPRPPTQPAPQPSPAPQPVPAAASEAAPAGWQARPSRDPFGFGLDGGEAKPAASPAPADDDLEFNLVDGAKPGAPSPVTPSPVAPSPVASSPAAASPVPAVANAVTPAVIARAEQALAQEEGGAPSREAVSAAAREIIERVVWEVVPELAETLIREEIERLLKQKGG